MFQYRTCASLRAAIDPQPFVVGRCFELFGGYLHRVQGSFDVSFQCSPPGGRGPRDVANLLRNSCQSCQGRDQSLQPPTSGPGHGCRPSVVQNSRRPIVESLSSNVFNYIFLVSYHIRFVL